LTEASLRELNGVSMSLLETSDSNCTLKTEH